MERTKNFIQKFIENMENRAAERRWRQRKEMEEKQKGKLFLKIVSTYHVEKVL